MSKVNEQIVHAFIHTDEKKIGNTFTDGYSIWLHDNLIIKSQDNPDGGSVEIYFSLAGWNTQTTRGRINALLLAFTEGYQSVSTKQGQPFITTIVPAEDGEGNLHNREEIESTGWYRVQTELVQEAA